MTKLIRIRTYFAFLRFTGFVFVVGLIYYENNFKPNNVQTSFSNLVIDNSPELPP